MRTVAALYIDPRGPYPKMAGVDCWDIERDARLYAGPHPVVAHPPCQLWVNLAAVNWKRYRRELPAWYDGGDDGGCFAAALRSVRAFGGVLEHPANSHAFPMFGLPRPSGLGWQRSVDGEWTCEVWQSSYGHRARKRTWLFAVCERPPELHWAARPGDAQVGWFDRIKPTLSKREASATPPGFAAALVELARTSKLQERAA